jgi:integrase
MKSTKRAPKSIDTNWGTIRPRPGKKGVGYQILWYEHGKQRSDTVKTPEEAAARLANIRAALLAGEVASPSKETLGSYLLRWLEETQPNVKAKTFRSYETNCRVHIIPALGHIRLAELKPAQIQAFYTKLGKTVYRRYKKSEDGKPILVSERPISPDTIATVHRIFRAALNRAVSLWQIPKNRNPIDGAAAPSTTNGKHHILSAEEAGRLLAASRPTGRYSLYLAALATGLRQSELCGLRWQDVDLEAGTISVNQQLVQAGLNPIFAPPKSKKSIRTLETPGILLEALRFDWEVEKQFRQDGMPYEYDLVWHVDNGRPIHQSNLDRQLKGLLKKAGLPDMKFHSLRATHASWQSRLGLTLADLQKHLGHTDVSTTMRYAKASPHAERVAADNIDKLLGGASK